MRIELINIESAIQQEVENKFTQKQVALTYAFGITSRSPIDWKKVNRMIIERWSMYGLLNVKKLAWKLVEEKRKQNHVD